MIYPTSEKKLRDLDIKLCEMLDRIGDAYDVLLEMDSAQRKDIERHHFRFELRGLEQAISGLRNKRKTVAQHLGNLLLGIK